MKKLSYLFALLTVFALAACGGGGGETATEDPAATGDAPAGVKEGAEASAPSNGMMALDLTDKGIPVTVMVPEGAEISEGLGAMEVAGDKYYCYEIKKDGFKLEVGSWESPSEDDIATLVADAKDAAQDDDDFEKFELEEENGIIYKLATEYGDDWSFEYYTMKDGRAIEFTTALNMSEYTLDDVKELYNAAKTAR